MIQSHNTLIADILRDINLGKIQLPDFQRGWVWEDYRIRALIASISNGYPIGAAMFLETGNENVNFKTRLIEGVDKAIEGVKPELLILDGQQRNTSIYRSMFSKAPVETTDTKKKPVKRFYYISIPESLNTLTDRIEAILSVPETKIITENIGRDIKLDLSTPEKEFENHCFPLNLVFDNVGMMQWQMDYNTYHRDNIEVQNSWRNFYSQILVPMIQYQIPVIKLGKDVPKEAVCQVFENVNQGGVSLTVFELVTASFAADNFELRKDWDRIWGHLKSDKLMSYKNYHSFSGTDFLTASTLLASYLDNKAGGTAVSCKKKDVLRLTSAQYLENKERLLGGLKEALKFLKEQCIYTSLDLPYTSQLVPLSVLFAIDKNIWFDSTRRKKLEMWYWCGVFGELYGGANETRYVTDVVGMMEWVVNDSAKPDTVVRSNFYASRLQHLYTRNSAAYKGVMALILKAGALDFIKGSRMDFATFTEEMTDIHHIFPASYCEKQNVDRERWNSVVNKTPIFARTNRIVGGVAPSQYISSIERNHKVSPDDLDVRLASHQIDVASIRSNDFDAYFNSRYQSLLDLIEQATGKQVSGRDDMEIDAATPFEKIEMNFDEE